MNVQQMQDRVYANKIKRGFNTTEVWPEIIHLMEELGELATAFRDENQVEMVDAVGDLIVFGLGLFSIFGQDAEMVLEKIIINNETRPIRNQGINHG